MTVQHHATDIGAWRVTAQHHALSHTSAYGPPTWQPWGLLHARQVGDTRSLCGEPTIGWPTIWELTFEVDDPATCPRCARHLRAIRAMSISDS